MITIAKNITCSSLSFSFEKTSNNPNIIFNTGKANCIGYASLFNSIMNYLINKSLNNKNYKSYHVVGKISFMDIDIHQLSNDPFFKDHDYVMIEDINTKERIYIDPSLNDYLNINRVSGE